MAYDEFQNDPGYASKHAGAALEIQIYDENNPGQPLIGAATGINISDDLEVIPIEEAGNEGIDEQVQGRHSLNFTIQAFWSPERNDKLPTRLDFIGKKYTIFVKIARKKEGVTERAGAGETTDVITGCVFSRIGSAFGARGSRTFDIAGSAEFRYTGAQWFALAS